jgi:hypothetical protein
MFSQLRCAAAVVAASLTCASIAYAQEVEDAAPTDGVITFMRAKLEHSQDALEGLTTENFELIAKSAGQMEVLSQEAAWQVLQTPEYRLQSGEFRRATRAMKDAALKKNLDGAALAYVDLTLKCVRCHEYVRHVRAASVDGIPLPSVPDSLLIRAAKQRTSSAD